MAASKNARDAGKGKNPTGLMFKNIKALVKLSLGGLGILTGIIGIILVILSYFIITPLIVNTQSNSTAQADSSSLLSSDIIANSDNISDTIGQLLNSTENISNGSSSALGNATGPDDMINKTISINSSIARIRDDAGKISSNLAANKDQTNNFFANLESTHLFLTILAILLLIIILFHSIATLI